MRSVVETTPTVLAEGLTFPEGPRWCQGKLWFSDFYSHAVYTVDLVGKQEKIVDVPQQPSGLGWLPNGDLLIVSMLDRRLMRFDGRKLALHADLFDLADFHCNDMVVDARGVAYVGNFGFDEHDRDGERRATSLIKVMPDGSASKVAEEMWFPNGAVITPDDSTLIVAETFANRLTAFDVLENGDLGNRRVWADLGEFWPDGIALDKQGGIWVAPPRAKMVIRVEEGGQITHEIPLEHEVFSCALGGEAGELLFLCTSIFASRERRRVEKQGRIEMIRL